MGLTLFCMCFLSWVFHRRTAFLPAVSGIVGKGLEREIMRPFLCLRRFGAHSETPFSSPFFRRTAFFPAVSGMVGKGLERETLLPFPRLRRFGTHCETGSKFLLLFSIKSKEERLCFAVKVLNWRTSHLHQPPMIFLYLLRCPLRQILHRVQQLPIPINPIMQMRPCGKPRIPRFCHHLSLLDFLPLFHQYL